MQPLVSILIPTYKRAHLLPQAIRSALAQTYPNIEILVLDDCSPDDTPAAVTPFTREPSLRYVRHTTNRGLPGNWQKGIEAARGEFFTLLHDDDAFEPTFIEKLLAPLLADPDLALAFCDQWVMDAAGQRSVESSNQMSRKFKRAVLPPGRVNNLLRVALLDCSISIAACLFRRGFVSPDLIHPEAGGGNDIWLFYQSLRTGHGAFYIPERLANYRAHDGGMSAEAPLYMVNGHLFRLEHMLADPKMSTLHPELRILRRRALADKGLHLVHLGRRAEARRTLMNSLAMGPTKRSIGGMLLSMGGAVGTLVMRHGRARPMH